MRIVELYYGQEIYYESYLYVIKISLRFITIYSLTIPRYSEFHYHFEIKMHLLISVLDIFKKKALRLFKTAENVALASIISDGAKNLIRASI